MADSGGGFFGGLSRGLNQGLALGQQRRQFQQEKALQQEQLQEQRRQFDLQHELQGEEFDALEFHRKRTGQREEQLLQIEQKKTDLLVIERMQTALGSKTPHFARGFLIEELARMLDADPKSERVKQLTKMAQSSDADTRQAMTSIISELRGLPPGMAAEFMQLVFNGEVSLHELLKLSADANQPEPFTLSPGQTRFGGGGQPLASVPEAPESFTLGEGQQRFEGGESIAEVPPAQPKTNIMGPIPPGQRLEFDEQGRPSQLTDIPGGPSARKAQEAARKRQEKQGQRQKYGDVVTEDVGRLIGMIEESTLPIAGWGALMSGIPGTASRDAAALLETIKSNAGFDRLQEMRSASPTGGALGQVSDFENKMLQATIGNLEQSQSEAQLINNLKRVRNIYLDTIHGVGEWQLDDEGEAADGGVERMSDEELLEILRGDQ